MHRITLALWPGPGTASRAVGRQTGRLVPGRRSAWGAFRALPHGRAIQEPRRDSRELLEHFWVRGRFSKPALILGSLALVLPASAPTRAAGITSMQIVAVTKNAFPDIAWPWPATAVRIVTVDENTQGKVADIVVLGESVGVQFSLNSCLIKRPALACTPSAATTPCCVLSSTTLPTEIDLLPDSIVPPGDYMVYLAAPGSSLKGEHRAPPAKARQQPRGRPPSPRP
jgi:hypothetical protein